MKLDTTAPRPGKRQAGAGVHRLLVLYSPANAHTGVTVALASKPVRVGRAAEPLALDDAQLSREHAVVERVGEPGKWRVRDLDSRNGSFVNGERVTERELVDGDVLRLGAHLLLFQFLTLEACEQLALAPRVHPVLLGESWAMHRVRQAVSDAAVAGTAVLVLGESGVGKELVAQEIHRLSGRTGAFVPVNCAALPEHLAESELFGHAKGAFTGATGASTGLFGAAEGGTLFLDEIGEISAALQAKLLRALANGEVRAVGETQARRADVRVVAATNVDLEAAVDEGKFRGDLFARLNGGVVRVPALRERREDILPLVAVFLERERSAVEVDPDAAEALVIHPWRFNVRELEQAIRTAAPRARAAARLELDHLPEAMRVGRGSTAVAASASAADGAAPEQAPLLLRVRRDAIPTAPELELVLRHFGGNVVKVAAFFGRDRKQVYRWAERLGVDLDSYRT